MAAFCSSGQERDERPGLPVTYVEIEEAPFGVPSSAVKHTARMAQRHQV